MPRVAGWRAGMAGLLMLGMGVPVFFNAGISVLAPLLVIELSLTRAELGSIAAVAYLVAMGTATRSGRMADRISMRTSLLVLFVVSVSSILLLAVSIAFWMVLAAAILAGLSEGANAPITNRLVGRSIEPRHQGLAIGIKQSGVKVSHLVAGAILPTAALLVGWRLALGVGILAGLLGIGLAFTFIGPNGVAVERDPNVSRQVDRRIWVLSAYAGVMGMAQAPVQLYLPLFAVESVGMDVRQGGLVLAMSSGVAIVARIAWGAYATRIEAFSRPLAFLAAGSAGSVAALAASVRFGPAALWFGALGFGLTAAVWSTLVHISIMRSTASHETGWASGIVHTAFLGGFASSPVVFGAVVDHLGGYSLAWIGSIILFSVAGVAVFFCLGDSQV